MPLVLSLKFLPFPYMRLPMGTTKLRIEHFIDGNFSSIATNLAYDGRPLVVKSIFTG
jgi:hypothetical protein